MFKSKYIVISILLTLFALTIIPSSANGDTLIHIPFILKKVDPTIFPKDYLLQHQNPQTDTLYYSAIAQLIRISGLSLNTAFNILFGISLFTFFYALITITQVLQIGLFTGFLWSLLFLLRIPIGGSAITTLETEAIPRTIALAISSWCFVFFFQKKYTVAVILLGLTAAVHPLTAIFVCFISFGYFIANKKIRIKYFGLFLLVISVPLVLISQLSFMSQNWLEIIKLRNSYAFINLWQPYSWLILIISLLPGFWLTWHEKSSQILSRLFKITSGMALLLSFIHILFAIIIPLPLIIQLQLGRIWWYPVAISLASLAYYISKYPKQLIRLVALILLLILVTLRNLMPIRKDQIEWIEAANWTQTSTQSNCLFLVPFNNLEFRAFSQRSITGQYKDGALSFYSADFAFEWDKRRRELSNWENFPEEQIVNLQKIYKFDYFITTEKNKFSFIKSYENSKITIYQMTPTCLP